MCRMTFVFEYPDGQEPSISVGMTYLGGNIVTGSFSDLSEENEKLEERISELEEELAWKD